MKAAADLVPKEVAERWLKYLREELPTIAFKCSTQKQATNLSHRSMPLGRTAKKGGAKGEPRAGKGAAAGGSGGGDTGGSACLGAETLLQLLKNYARNSNIKTAITVGACRSESHTGLRSMVIAEYLECEQ